jgi:hypothetical protein
MKISMILSRAWREYKRCLDWWSDLLDFLIQCVTILYILLLHIHKCPQSRLYYSLLGSCFQRRTFPFIRVPEIAPASDTSFSQLNRSCSLTNSLITNLSWLEHLGTDRTENTVPLFLCHCFVSVGVPTWSLLSHCIPTAVVCRDIT